MTKKICIVTTMSSSINNWIKPFISDYLRNDFEITIICNDSSNSLSEIKELFPNVDIISYEFPRGSSITGSIKSINFLSKFFKKNKFDIVQYSTPNASFYSSVAARFRKIPVRLYCQWGMVYVTRKGLKRLFFKTIEKITCKNSTMIEPDSVENLSFCRNEKLYTDKKSRVIWNGSAKGIDLAKYDLSLKDSYQNYIFGKYPELKDSFVLGFVGRLGAEKGCNELFKAFQQLECQIPNCKLLFVGPLEKEHTIEPDLLEYFKSNRNIIKTDRVSDVEKYYSVMDLFVLPSYREGFGMSVVEAEAFGVPVIVSEYPGPVGGMRDKKTGIIIRQKSVEEIVDSVKMLYKDETLRKELSNNAVSFAKESFDYEIFRQKYIDDRKELVK